MYFSKVSVVSFGLLATSKLVAGHAAIIGATGDQGGAGSAIGVDPNTPRDGTRRNPFQQDSTRFKGDAAAICGETLGAGDNDIQAGTKAVMAMNGPTLPQISAGGALMMTVHQVNGDGAGPYTCMIDSTGTGTAWTQMQVTTNLAGNARGRNNDNQKKDLPLNVAIAADQTCTGTVAGQSNICMVRCQNPARAGPFGGCVPVQMAGAATAGAAQAGTGAQAAAQPATGANTAQAGAAQAAQAGTAQAGTAQTGTGSQAAAQPATGANTAQAGAAQAAQAGTAQTGAGAQAAAQPANGSQAGATGAQSATPQLTNDDQEEEVSLVGDDISARYVVTDN